MNEKPTIEVGKVPIITKFIYTLGVLPTSYLMSMTYQEQVTWLCNYIQTTLIPQINEDVEAIQELQNLYELLRTYVNTSIEEFETSVNNEVQSLEDFMNNYFNNLDVQEEIDRKLDIMASNGTLAQIIEDYATIPELTSRVQTLESNDKNTIILIGDSYGDGTDTESRTYWSNRIGNILHKNTINMCEGSAGYVRTGNRGRNFNDNLNLAYNSTSFDNNDVDKIIVYGGYNDYMNISAEDFENGVNIFLENAKTKYPNSEIIVFGINYPHNPISGSDPRYPQNFTKILKECCISNGVSFGDSTCWLWGYTDVLISDNVHPNVKGTNIIVSKMCSYFTGLQTNNLHYTFDDRPTNRKGTYIDNLKITYKRISNNCITTSLVFNFTQALGGELEVFRSIYDYLTIPEEQYYPIYEKINNIMTVVGTLKLQVNGYCMARITAPVDETHTYYVNDIIWTLEQDIVNL